MSGCEARDADLVPGTARGASAETVKSPKRPLFAEKASPTAALWGDREAPGGMQQVGDPRGVWAGSSEASTPSLGRGQSAGQLSPGEGGPAMVRGARPR